MTNYFQGFINKAADKVYYWWEEFKYQNEGLGLIDKVAQFADWIDECDDESLARIGGVSCDYDGGIFVRHLRAAIVKGIDNWFEEAKPW